MRSPRPELETDASVRSCRIATAREADGLPPFRMIVGNAEEGATLADHKPSGMKVVQTFARVVDGHAICNVFEPIRIVFVLKHSGKGAIVGERDDASGAQLTLTSLGDFVGDG